MFIRQTDGEDCGANHSQLDYYDHEKKQRCFIDCILYID